MNLKNCFPTLLLLFPDYLHFVETILYKKSYIPTHSQIWNKKQRTTVEFNCYSKRNALS